MRTKVDIDFLEKAMTDMKELAKLSKGDVEICHSAADDLLCEVVERLGMYELAEDYRSVKKWYS